MGVLSVREMPTGEADGDVAVVGLQGWALSSPRVVGNVHEVGERKRAHVETNGLDEAKASKKMLPRGWCRVA